MAGSVVAACEKLSVLAIERNWGTYLHQGALGPSAVKQRVLERSTGETQLCKRTPSPGVLDKRLCDRNAFST